MLALSCDRTAAVMLTLRLEGFEPMLEQHWLWVLWRCEWLVEDGICYENADVLLAVIEAFRSEHPDEPCMDME